MRGDGGVDQMTRKHDHAADVEIPPDRIIRPDLARQEEKIAAHRTNFADRTRARASVTASR